MRGRRRHLGRVLAASGALAAATCGLGAAGARADGYCGADPSGPTACGITTNTTVVGTMATEATYSYDYYVFFARPDTQLSVTLNDTENPLCSVEAQYEFCGAVSATLYDGRGHELVSSDNSSPEGGVPDPVTFSRTLREGVYYVAVEDLSDQHRPQTYSLTVSGSPAVTWPHPCVVPKVSRNEHLGTARRGLGAGSCRSGRVRHVRDRHVDRGDVVRFAPGSGAIRAPGARVELVVSSG